jgi:hypothetical protein
MNLYAMYQKQVKKLELTERELLERREEIVGGIDHEQKAAKLSVLNRRIEEDIADGNPEAAQAEKEKLAAIGEESAKIENEIKGIDLELVRMGRDKKRIAEHILVKKFGEIRAAVDGNFEKAVKSADDGWRALKSYSRELGMELPKCYRDGLIQPWVNSAAALKKVLSW